MLFVDVPTTIAYLLIHAATNLFGPSIYPSVKCILSIGITGWWFQICFFLMFTPIWRRFPFWLILFQRGLKPPTRWYHESDLSIRILYTSLDNIHTQGFSNLPLMQFCSGSMTVSFSEGMFCLVCHRTPSSAGNSRSGAVAALPPLLKVETQWKQVEFSVDGAAMLEIMSGHRHWYHEKCPKKR